MRNFVSGIPFTLIVLCAGGYWIFEKGYVNFAAEPAVFGRRVQDRSGGRRRLLRMKNRSHAGWVWDAVISLVALRRTEPAVGNVCCVSCFPGVLENS